MFSKQCSEAPFTCHINALFLSMGTEVFLCFSKQELILIDTSQQKDFTVFLFTLKWTLECSTLLKQFASGQVTQRHFTVHSTILSLHP